MFPKSDRRSDDGIGSGGVDIVLYVVEGDFHRKLVNISKIMCFRRRQVKGGVGVFIPWAAKTGVQTGVQAYTRLVETTKIMKTCRN